MTGFSSTVISSAFRRLRELEFVGKAGSRPGHNNLPQATWRVMDANALDTMRAKVAAEQAESNGQPA